jgi:membrane protease YdiL (CAAX protease family)
MSSPEALRFSIAILWWVVGFGSYYFLSKNSTLSGKFGSIIKLLDPQGNQVLLQRALGFLFLGILSVLIISLLPDTSVHDYGLTFHFREPPPAWFWLLFPLALILVFFAARKPGNLEQYPQIRARTWTSSLLLINSLSWILFLVGYEFLFRGFVLYASLAILETGPAIVLNTALYTFAHFYKGPGETLGAIPAGIIFCYLTLLTGNIWSAVILHTVMALSHEWFSLKVHPEMHLTRVR